MNDLFLVLTFTIANVLFLMMLVVWEKRHDRAVRRERDERIRYYVSR